MAHSLPLVMLLVLACGLASGMASADMMIPDSVAHIETPVCLWQCGECFWNSDALLMTCANTLCIQRRAPTDGLVRILITRACPPLAEIMRHVSGGNTARVQDNALESEEKDNEIKDGQH